MVTVVPMPKTGAGVYREGVILSWAKKEGDAVKEKEPLAEIETEKAVMTYESPASGTVLKLLFVEGDTVTVGTPICLLGEPGELIPLEFLKPGQKVDAAAAGEKTPSPAVQQAAVEGANVSPAASRLAESMKVDLKGIVGTGPGGTIMREDVLRAARDGTPKQESVGQPKTVPLSTMRTTIAERLTKSHRETAPVTLIREVEVSSVATLVKAKGAEQKFGYNDVFIKAAAEALKRHPIMNSRLEGDKIMLFDEVNIGFAVALEAGLITPTIRNADRLSLADVAAQVRKLSERARSRQLTSDEYSAGTFTISNLGGFGIEGFTPIINPPQVGILGVGRVKERPWVENGIITVKPTVHLSLTFDHRVVDGADAAQFLNTLVGFLGETNWLGI